MGEDILLFFKEVVFFENWNQQLQETPSEFFDLCAKYNILIKKLIVKFDDSSNIH